MKTNPRAKFKCPNCKGQKRFEIIETMRHAYITDNNDDWGCEEELDSLETHLFCCRCKQEIPYNPEDYE